MDNLIHQQTVAAHRPSSLRGRSVDFTISTKDHDRDDDRILSWSLTAYKQNPVLMPFHDYRALPIGRGPAMGWDGSELLATVDFTPSGLNPQADQIFDMVKAGYLTGASVGFKPMAPGKPNSKGGLDYPQCELLEWSIVPIPSNPGTLAKALRALALRHKATKP
jgi:HK97 family phage prohead protease